MGTLVRTETLAHRIGADGRVSVKTISGLLSIRGTDGDEATLTIAYRIRAADQAAAERALETGRVIVDRGPSWLNVESPERRISTGLAWLFGGARVGADVSLEVPWATKVRIETMNGTIEASSLVGDQKYRTVSGTLRLWGLGGLIEASSISGAVTLDNGGDVRLRASSISGSVKVRARRFYGMTVNTTSGGISVVGTLDPGGDYRADSISGSVNLTPLSGVTAELRTISGNVSSEIENRLEGGRGFWRAIVGDGRTTFKVNSTSGGLRILAPGRDPGTWQSTPTPTAQPSTADPTTAGPGASTAAPEPVEDVVQSRETWTAEETSDGLGPVEVQVAAPSPAPASDPHTQEIDILRLLERGEISVDEAASRLERARRSGDVG